MSRASGWRLDFDEGAHAVIGQGSLIRLLHAPRLYEVPCTPAYCRHVISWERGLLPLFDLGVWLRGQPRETPSCIGIVAFRGDDRELQFGALALLVPPRRIDVDDAWGCALPETEARWRAICCSCFEMEERPYPILDLRRLFTLMPAAVGGP